LPICTNSRMRASAAERLLDFGPRGLGAKPRSSPLERCSRHLLRCDDQSPSRRSSAPISPGREHASASVRIRRLYFAENCRRFAFDVTSVGGVELASPSFDLCFLTLDRLVALSPTLGNGRCLSHVGTEGLPCQLRPYFSSRSSTCPPRSCFRTSKSPRPSVKASGKSSRRRSTFSATTSVERVSGSSGVSFFMGVASFMF